MLKDKDDDDYWYGNRAGLHAKTLVVSRTSAVDVAIFEADALIAILLFPSYIHFS